jgi:chromosome segregation ATPase
VEPATTAGGKDQAFWQNRLKAAMDDLNRTQMFADSLQTKINSLRTDFVNRDNRVEREKIQMDLNASLAELEKLNKEIVEKRKAVSAVEEEARKAGVPPGWLRPGA